MSARTVVPPTKVTVRVPGSQVRRFSVNQDLGRQILRMAESDAERLVSTASFEAEVLAKVSAQACKLSTRRWQAQMTQKALAEAAGIQPSHLSSMEHGKRLIGEAVAKRLAKVLGTDWRELISPAKR